MFYILTFSDFFRTDLRDSILIRLIPLFALYFLTVSLIANFLYSWIFSDHYLLLKEERKKTVSLNSYLLAVTGAKPK